ncbi:MAG: Ubiquinone/menaquinone biosynthesis C-methyltransferase UbiE [Fimbriimonadaceae bacterium]|nr:Ubiquinone/menaquinone biosynthesis C-methyltransferase UbiE [Fimbriimonadaceae bacterium]
MELSDHARKNREAWTSWSKDFEEPGRRCWASDAITWGIWNLPEEDIQALGDPSWFRGKDVLELGCGTAYFSAWFAKLGARPVGLDITPAQLERARAFQGEFGIAFPLIEASAEHVPLVSGSFDVVFSEYGASIWCDPDLWIPEAVRLLRPGGKLIFLVNGFLSMLCSPDTGVATDVLVRDWFGDKRFQFDAESVEFHLSYDRMIQLLRRQGMVIENLICLRAPAADQEMRFDYITQDWSRRWPSEEIWSASKPR